MTREHAPGAPEGTCWKTHQGYQVNVRRPNGSYGVGIGPTPYDAWLQTVPWDQRGQTIWETILREALG